ncbi:hypothetical protein BJ742DRAFT_806855 [Cladochytrium replicatum]|nr:hypothetical protein BJ742DRAFT_806855 [Cladochytrium replicatum]
MATQSWVDVAEDCDFSILNIPFGIISTKDNPAPRAATAIGNYVVDLAQVASNDLFVGPLVSSETAIKLFSQATLNDFAALGRPYWREVRARIQTLLSDTAFKSNITLIPLASVKNHLPVRVGDYTDFYSSKEHAFNVGVMFRGADNALMPNWVHIPVGYHGRSSSVVVSGTSIKRPSGIINDPQTKTPKFSLCKRLDIELEMAFIIGPATKLGEQIKCEYAEEYIFGVVLMNDWSARDIQVFEYVPLGPFLGKNFGTTVSPWIVTLDALADARVKQPVQDPRPADYLLDPTSDANAFNVNLEVHMKPKDAKQSAVVSRSNLKYMYWSFKQQLAHHTIGGCNMNPGDLCGTGTLSGPTPDSYGSLLELCWNATKPLEFDGGAIKRTFLEDGDEVVLRGYAEVKGGRVGFGDCAGVIIG